MSRSLILLVAVVLLAGVAAAGAKPDTPADLLFEYAEGLYRDGLHKLAIPEFEKFLKLYPKNVRAPAAHFDLGECYYATRDFKAALPRYQAALAAKTLRQRPVALYRIGDILFRLKHTERVIEPLKQFLAMKLLTPDHRRFIVHAKYTLARACFIEGKLKEALPLFREVLIDPSPDNTYKAYVLLPIGDCLSALGQPGEALLRYRDLESYLVASIKTKQKDDPTLLAQRTLLDSLRTKIASLLLQQRKYAEALAAFGLVPDKGQFAQEIVYGRAQCLFYLERYQEALVPALAYLKRFAEGKQVLDCLYIAGESYYRTARYAEAEKHLGDLLARDKEGKHPAREAAAFGWVAAAYHKGKAHAKAIAAAADTFLKLFPKSRHAPDVHYFRAEAAYWLAAYEPAVAHYQKVPGNGPYGEEATYKIAACLDLLKKQPDAAVAYDTYLTRYGDKGKHYKQSLERTARLWGKLHRYDKAAERYGAFVKRFAEADAAVAEEFLYRKGACEFETQQYEAMYQSFKAYFDRHPQGQHKGNALYFLAWYHSERKRQYDIAAQLFELAGGIPGPNQVRARYQLAHTHNRIAKQLIERKHRKEADGHFAQAAGIFLELMAKHPDQLAGAPEYVWTAQVFREQGQLAKAVQAYEALIKRYPKEATETVVYWLGQLSLQRDPPDLKRAETYFRRFVGSHKDHAYYIWSAYGLAEALKGLDKDTEAWEWYQKVEKLAAHVIADATKRDALVLRCRLQMGRMAFEAKQWEHARDYLLRVGYLASGDVAGEALYKAGIALLQLKDAEAAIAVFNRLVRLFPKSEEAKRLLKELAALGLRLGDDGKTIEAAPAGAPPAKPKPGTAARAG